MSVSVLTTMLAVAAAPAPSADVAVSVAPPVVETAAGSVESSPPTGLAQPAEPQSTAPAQSAEPSASTGPAQPGASALPPQPESQALVPAGGQPELVVTGRRRSPDDPLEQLNATSFEVTQSVDKAVVAPVAFAYEDIMPRPFRQGLSNFLHNLGEPVVFLNYLLQLKPGKAAETFGRFAINTAVGAGGLVDVAKRKPFNLPHRRNGLANTLGYYGVPQGPYFYLPLIGPTTLRDFIGGRLDLLVLPLAIGKEFSRPEIAIPVAALSELNSRIELDDELRAIRATRDPYVAARSYYLRRRQAEIDALHGRGDGKVPVTVSAPASSDPVPAPTNPTPAQNPPAEPSVTGQ